MKYTKYLLLYLFISFSWHTKAQDLLSLIDDSSSVQKDFTVATFKTTRLINMHTLETVGPRTLDFRISHRFGPLNSGKYNAWGIDGPANIRLSLEYSPDGRFMFGIGRSSYEKLLDGFLKYRLLRQRSNGGMPVSMTLFSGMYYTAQKDPNEAANGYNKYEYTTSRMAYNFQMIIGRKFSPSFSMQIAPWFNHYNLVDRITDNNDVYGIATCIRLKFTQRAAITFEYAYRINKYSNTKYYDSMGIGYELETGGHVFQIHLTNSFGISESQYFSHTESKWNDAGIRLGFNISRVFTL